MFPVFPLLLDYVIAHQRGGEEKATTDIEFLSKKDRQFSWMEWPVVEHLQTRS